MFARFRTIYKLRVEHGTVRVMAGTPPARFLADVRDIVTLHGIDGGEIECKGVARHARLRFSNDFPTRGRQAIRNVWPAPTGPGPSDGSRASG